MIKYALMSKLTGHYMGRGWKFNIGNIADAYFYETPVVARDNLNLMFSKIEREQFVVIEVVFEVKQINWIHE